MRSCSCDHAVCVLRRIYRMDETQLRTALEALGLPTDGDQAAMVARLVAQIAGLPPPPPPVVVVHVDM